MCQNTPAPLTKLLKKDVVFKFGEEQERAFETLKLTLITDPVLKLFRIGAQTEVHIDASQDGIGAVLLQKDEEDETLHPVYNMRSI